MAQDFADQQAKMSIKTISEVTELVGNTHRSKGTVTPADILSMYEKVEITFRSTGEPNMPSIIAGGQMADQINAALIEIQGNEEYKQKFNQIMENKKKEWYDRENNRKLVD